MIVGHYAGEAIMVEGIKDVMEELKESKEFIGRQNVEKGMDKESSTGYLKGRLYQTDHRSSN